MLRPSSMEAKLTRWRVASTAFFGLCTLLLPISALAHVPPGGLPWAVTLIRDTVKAASPSRAAASEMLPRARWRTKSQENMALSEGANYLRAWKLLPDPLSLSAKTDVPDLSPEQLDSLVEALDGQLVRIHIPKEKAQFQSFDLRQHYPTAKQSVAYALTSVEAEETSTMNLQLRTSNGVRVWINGELVLTQPAVSFGRAATAGTEVVLDAGENVILVECAQAGRDWGFTLGLSNPERIAGREVNRTAANTARP